MIVLGDGFRSGGQGRVFGHLHWAQDGEREPGMY